MWSVVMHNQSWTYGSLSHLQPAWTHRSWHQCTTAAARLWAQTGKYHQKYSATSTGTPKTPNRAITWTRPRQQHRENGHNFSTFRGKTVSVGRWVALSIWPTHSCIERCAKPGGFVCYIFLSELVYAHTEACTYIHKGCVRGGMVMQWQEYHTYFPVRESLSLLWGRKTTSMTETQVHTQNKRRTWV